MANQQEQEAIHRTYTVYKCKPLKDISTKSFLTWKHNCLFAKLENGWSDRLAVSKAYNSITGEAEHLASRNTPRLPPIGSNEPCITLEEYLEALQDIFIPQSTRTIALQDFRSAKQRPKETLQAWSNRLYDDHTLAFPAYTDDERDRDENLISAFTNGLMDRSLMYSMLSKTFTSYRTALDFVLKARNNLIQLARHKGYEAMLELQQTRPGLAYTIDPADVPPEAEEHHSINQLQPNNNQGNRGRPRSRDRNRRNQPGPSRPRSSSGSRSRGQPPAKKRRLCWLCGSPDHLRHECPRNKSLPQSKSGKSAPRSQAARGFYKHFEQQINSLSLDTRTAIYDMLDQGQDSDSDDEETPATEESQTGN